MPKNTTPSFFHLDKELAKDVPFGGIIASGFLTISIVWGLFIKSDVMGLDSRGGIGMNDVRWKKPVYPGDKLFTQVEVIETKQTSKGDKGIVKMQFLVKNQHREVALEFKTIGLVAV